MMELEICIDSVDSAVAAERGGAQRVELCSALLEGGLTPSVGLVRAVRKRIGIGLYMMIRPRGGDFFYSDEEFEAMRDDIAFAKEVGADGVVFGLLLPNGDVDVDRTRELIELAKTADFSSHVAIEEAIKQLAAQKGLGFGDYQAVARLAVTGTNVGPSITQIFHVFGRERVLRRLERFQAVG